MGRLLSCVLYSLRRNKQGNGFKKREFFQIYFTSDALAAQGAQRDERKGGSGGEGAEEKELVVF